MRAVLLQADPLPVGLSSEALAPIVTLESGGASPPLHAAGQLGGHPIDFLPQL